MGRYFKQFMAWLEPLVETGETCPRCGGAIVQHLGWDDEHRHCRDCRYDHPEEAWRDDLKPAKGAAAAPGGWDKFWRKLERMPASGQSCPCCAGKVLTIRRVGVEHRFCERCRYILLPEEWRTQRRWRA